MSQSLGDQSPHPKPEPKEVTDIIYAAFSTLFFIKPKKKSEAYLAGEPTTPNAQRSRAITQLAMLGSMASNYRLDPVLTSKQYEDFVERGIPPNYAITKAVLKRMIAEVLHGYRVSIADLTSQGFAFTDVDKVARATGATWVHGKVENLDAVHPAQATLDILDKHGDRWPVRFFREDRGLSLPLAAIMVVKLLDNTEQLDSIALRNNHHVPGIPDVYIKQDWNWDS